MDPAFTSTATPTALNLFQMPTLLPAPPPQPALDRLCIAVRLFVVALAVVCGVLGAESASAPQPRPVVIRDLDTLKRGFALKLTQLNVQGPAAASPTDVTQAVREAVDLYRIQLLDLRRHLAAADDEFEAGRVTAELARLEVAYPRPTPPVTRVPGGLERGLVVHYGFDECDNHLVADLSPNTNTGSLLGAVWAPRARDGGGGFIDRSGDCIQAPGSVSCSLTQALTLSLCVGPRLQPDAPLTLLSRSGPANTDLWLGIGEDLNLTAGVRCGPPDHTLVLLPPPRDGDRLDGRAWVHLALTYDGRTLVTYVNGRVDRRAEGCGPPTLSAAPIHIGGCPMPNRPGNHTTLVDDLLIWNRALTEVEILGLWAWLMHPPNP